MIKNRSLLVVTLICFIGINTSYFWDSFLGILYLPLSIACFITLVIVLLLLFRQIYLMIRERFTDKPRIYSIAGLVILLALIGTDPFGFDFEKREGKIVFLASHVGGGNCASILKLTDDYRYYAKDVCFGVEHKTGTYSIANDTIKFKSNFPDYANHYFAFGIIKKNQLPIYSKITHLLYLYRSAGDTATHAIMAIKKNELVK